MERLIRQSILQGSAADVLGSMRCGLLTPALEETRPFDSLQQVWDVIYEKALAGSPFRQNMIGNTYFWLDIVEIRGKRPGDFPGKDGFTAYLQESTLACIPWFEKTFEGGMGFAGRNLYMLYHDGKEGWLAPSLRRRRRWSGWAPKRAIRIG